MPLVTTVRMRAAYALLRQCPPFDRWGMPEPEEIKFEFLAGRDHAEYSLNDKDRMTIGINPDTHLTLSQLMESMAHEMVHLRQDMLDKLPNDGDKAHNAHFRKLARIVCRNLGFDIQRF